MTSEGLRRRLPRSAALWRRTLEVRLHTGVFDIEIDNDERGVIGDFTTISDIRITKADSILT